MDWPAIIAADSSDETLLVWADWLSEHEDEETAAGVRWLVRLVKRPLLIGVYSWWNGAADSKHREDLCFEWWNTLDAVPNDPYSMAKDFSTLHDALLAAAERGEK